MINAILIAIGCAGLLALGISAAIYAVMRYLFGGRGRNGSPRP